MQPQEPFQPGAVRRESYAAALARLDELARGAGPAQLAGVGDEILAVADLLERQPRLRRALTDPARTRADRAGLLASVIEGKVSSDTAALLRTLVAGRWSTAADLLDSAEQLGAEALLAGAESGGELGEVENELFRFGQLVESNVELSGALGTSTVPASQRYRLARALLSGKVRPVALRLVDLALHGFGGRGFAASLTRLVEQAAQRRDRQIAYVTVARSITPDQQQRLAARLSQLYRREVELK